MEQKKQISIIIPTWNEEGNIEQLIHRLDKALRASGLLYELIFIDDHSTDATQRIIKHLKYAYPISLFIKQGKKGKAQSLLEGFSYAQNEVVAMIDADLQYPPEAIPHMFSMINNETDIIIARRSEKQTSMIRRFISNAYRTLFCKWMHGFEYDVQSGLKVFKKEILERVSLAPSGWSFDLEFLVKAQNAGYAIDEFPIVFTNRHAGKTKIGLIKTSAEIGLSTVVLKLRDPEIVPFNQRQINEHGQGFHFRGNRFVHHNALDHRETAFFRFDRNQIIVTAFLLLFSAIFISLNWHAALQVFIAGLTIMYFIDLLFYFLLISRSFTKKPEIYISKKEIDAVKNSEWPKYTIFCPLYKEWQVVPQFISAMSKLDYPKNKLQVMLLLEEDDKESIDKIQSKTLPNNFTVVVVPHSMPKTKPKALNYGLQFATGEYTVIYDAEDIPESQQLKKAVLAFKKLGKKTACVQAKLNFYNPRQNILTRAFTAEYSLWFDLVLTGLQSINALIPLGGTSNHFRTKDLYTLKGWDSFNVTEDADLGIRLAKLGFKTAIVDATTYEEANSKTMNWFNQRSRWIKGYIQTYLVHMRRPKQLLQNIREPHLFVMQLVIGGKILSMLINPFLWILTITYFIFRREAGHFIESFFPAPILYMGVLSLIFGNFLYMYYYMIGCAKRGYDDLIKYVFLVPLYWLGMSFAATKAIYEIVVKPHYWAKTIHGLHLQKQKNAQLVESVKQRTQEKTNWRDTISSIIDFFPALTNQR